MMQQPVNQNDQITAQQMQQQMVLCPVRVVYETQVLVQPGEHIQPNQTLFINPQNTPPWAQNRQVQNQLIYVQQMPGNMMQSIPQHMDQNQLYLHQYQNYPQGVQVIPQQMVQNMQERQIHMQNVIHPNMLQNYQSMGQNVGQNVQIQDRIQQANYGQIHQNIGANLQMQAQTQYNLANNTIVSRASEMPSIQTQTVQQNQYNQKIEMKPVYNMNVGQVSQQTNVGRPQPQIITVNPIQNMPQQTNMQTFAQNIVRPIKTESVASQITPPTFVNAAQNTQITRIRKITPNNTINKMNAPNVGIRAAGQAYRPIQPRPQQYRPNLPNYSNTAFQSQANSMPILNQNVNINSNISVPNQNTNTTNFIKAEDSSNSRKRKSESPDEIHKKMAAIQVNITTPMKHITNTNTTKPPSETHQSQQTHHATPIHRNEMTVTPHNLPPNNVNVTLLPQPTNAVQIIESNDISKFIQNVQNSMSINRDVTFKPNTNVEAQSFSLIPKDSIQNMTDKDKLIRNTVYTQARGRVLSDKDDIMKETTTPELVNLLKPNPEPIVMKEMIIPPKVEKTTPHNEVKLETYLKSFNDANIIKQEIKTTIKQEIKNSLPKDTKEQPKIEIKKEEPKAEVKEEIQVKTDMNVSLNTTNNKGMFPVERSVKQERDYILTHVLDGIVIQESNVAFPIREPLTKRMMHQNQLPIKQDVRIEEKNVEIKTKDSQKEAKTKESKKESLKKCKSIERRKEAAQSEAKETSSSGKRLEEDRRTQEEVRPTKEEVRPTLEEVRPTQEEVPQGGNPFLKLSAATVKSWTTQELAAHLTKYEWEETAHLLVEHEIDGESLYLVSKGQLQHIGVKETHADVICAFVKN